MRPRFSLEHSPGISVSRLGDLYTHNPQSYAQVIPQMITTPSYIAHRRETGMLPAARYPRAIPHPGYAGHPEAGASLSTSPPVTTRFTSGSLHHPMLLPIAPLGGSAAIARQLPLPTDGTAVPQHSYMKPQLQPSNISVQPRYISGQHTSSRESSSVFHSIDNINARSNNMTSKSETVLQGTASNTNEVASHIHEAQNPLGRYKLSEEDLNKPALAQQSISSSNKELDIMTKGLKMQQQEWAEKIDLKKCYADFAQVAQLVNLLESVSDEVEEKNILNDLQHLVVDKLPDTIERLKKKTISSIEALNTLWCDIELCSQEADEQNEINKTLESVNLVEAKRNLKRAKKRRVYQEEFEKLARELVQYKSREVCKEEYETELKKLEEVKKETKLWIQINEARRSQSELALGIVRELMENVNSTSALKALVEKIQSASEDNSQTEIVFQPNEEEQTTATDNETFNDFPNTQDVPMVEADPIVDGDILHHDV